MIKINNIEVYGWEAAIRGMRNPMNSWDKSDSNSYYYVDIENGREYTSDEFHVGENDLALMKKLVAAGSDHAKFMRMVNASMDITAPLYWWKEFDTYKVGTVANSCSTMHKIHAKEFTLDDFSHEHLGEVPNGWIEDANGQKWCSSSILMETIINTLNAYRDQYLISKSKTMWWQMIQLLPSSYNQKRTVQMNYEVIRRMYFARKEHKLDEWRNFCEIMLNQLPYFEELIEE